MKKRATPLTDAWMGQLCWELEPRGRKAALARFLAGKAGNTVRQQQIVISRYLSGQNRPKIEVFLEVSEWLKKHPRTED